MLEMFKPKKKRAERRTREERVSRTDWIYLAYLVTIVCFIVALQFLVPSGAGAARQLDRRGRDDVRDRRDLLHARADELRVDPVVMAIAAPVGAYAARAVKMTAMPEMVALFNGVGGGAAALVALADFHNSLPEPGELDYDDLGRDRPLGADRQRLVRRQR